MNIPTPAELRKAAEEKETQEKNARLAKQIVRIEKEFSGGRNLPLYFIMSEKPKKKIIKMIEEKGYTVTVKFTDGHFLHRSIWQEPEWSVMIEEAEPETPQ